MSPDFRYSDLLPLGQDTTKYRFLGSEGVTTIQLGDKKFLHVSPEAITRLSETALHDISHYLRTAHLAQLANILDDPESSPNDRFVALDLLKNANISTGGVLPMWQKKANMF
jgi:fumarate hydratase class I